MHCSMMDRLWRISLDAYGGAVVALPLLPTGTGTELIVTEIAPFAHVKVEPVARRPLPVVPQAGPGPCCGGDADCAAPHIVAHGRLFIPHQPLWQPAQQVVLDEAGSGRQIVGHATDTEPGWRIRLR